MLVFVSAKDKIPPSAEGMRMKGPIIIIIIIVIIVVVVVVVIIIISRSSGSNRNDTDVNIILDSILLVVHAVCTPSPRSGGRRGRPRAAQAFAGGPASGHSQRSMSRGRN